MPTVSEHPFGKGLMSKASGKTAKNQDMQSLILQTALRLFSSHGYFNTSVQDIRREADVSIGSIYHYFASKEAIAKALFDGLVGRMADLMEDIMRRHEGTHDRCLAVIAQLFALTEADPDAMEFILYARHREFMPCEKPICSSKPFAMMKGMVEEGIARGELRKLDPMIAAAMLFGGAIRLIHLRLDGVIEAPLSAQLEEVWDCAWRTVKV